MAQSRVLGISEPTKSRIGFSTRATDLIFVLLAILNSVRLFRHAMWLDETHAFMLAAASPTPVDLFANLGHAGHPGLWYLLLWFITRFTINPIAMQVLHLLIALGIWLLIWFRTPFKQFEKILLLVSYYLFWEYFVISRSYALSMLLGFGFVALLLHRPQDRFWPLVLLGLLGNTVVFGTIWSFGLAGLFVANNKAHWRALLPGLAVFVGLTALAIATMLPVQWMHGSGVFAFVEREFQVSYQIPIRYIVGSFWPVYPPFFHDTLALIGDKAEGLADLLKVANIVRLVQESPVLIAGVFGLPFLACWSIVRDRLLEASYAATVIGILLFAELYRFEGDARHHGFLFVALVATVWLRRARPDRPVAPVWITLLVVNALAGLATLSSELRPYSNSRSAAEWLKERNLENEFLIGSLDKDVAPVAAYLERPVYYLGCQCFGTYLKWDRLRKSRLSPEEFFARLAHGLEIEGTKTGIVIVSQSYDPASQSRMPGIELEWLTSLQGAIKENYVIYRVTRRNRN